jgi:Domain of unknown function (DUF4198)
MTIARHLFAPLLFALIAVVQPAAAFDLFATHEVTAQFATHDGKPLADAEVRVFAPGDPSKPVLTGRTDKDGKFVFGTDRDGFWSVEAHGKTEVERIMIRVGGSSPEQKKGPLSPYWVLGLLGVLLVIAFWYRLLRIRSRR